MRIRETSNERIEVISHTNRRRSICPRVLSIGISGTLELEKRLSNEMRHHCREKE
jgi:hypothetical protein